MSSSPSRIRLPLLAGITLVMLAGWLYYQHHSYYSVPTVREPIRSETSGNEKNRQLQVLDLPVDHADPARGNFRGYYLFCPSFRKDAPITFILTDGQMELVSPGMDFGFFEDILPGASYVLIGVRGQDPLLFPEVYRGGVVDYAAAERLLGSDQQVEDIEWVRRDLVARKILCAACTINVFGASGAGVLAQQYVSKYGRHVGRLLLESTGAPDLARAHGLRYSPDFEDFNPEAARMLDPVLAEDPSRKPTICTVLYQEGRIGPDPRTKQIDMVRRLANDGSLWCYRVKPAENLAVLTYLLQSPREIAARVRWFELAGYDLLHYDTRRATNLLYEFSRVAIADMLEYHRTHYVPVKSFHIDRGTFTGEVLILKGTGDVVFADTINMLIQQAYPRARLMFFDEGHRLLGQPALYASIRNTFLSGGHDSLTDLDRRGQPVAWK